MITIYFILFFIAVILSFYFSGTEAAFIALNKPVYEKDVSLGHKKAILLKPFVQKQQKVLMLVLFGNNFANITCIYLATSIWLYFYGVAGQIYFISFITVFLFCVSEIIPKFIFRIFANEILYATIGILKFFDVVFSPVLTLMFFSVKPIFKLMKKDVAKDKNKLREDFSREDLRDIIEKGKEDGAFSEEQVTFMQKLTMLSQVKVLELMTPLADLLILHVTQDVMEVRGALKKEGRALIPVYEKRIDNIVGYVDTLDIYTSSKKSTIAKDYLKMPTYEPEICTIEKIYHQFQNSQNHMIVAVNEHGGCSGIITEFDVVMNIFGLRYERSKKVAGLINEVYSGCYHVDSSVDIDDLNEMLGMNIKKVGFETLGGFAIYLFGGLASRGMSMFYGEIKIKILKATHRSIEEVAIIFPEKRKKSKRTTIGK